jgi:molybdate transport system regulatory protein
MMASPVIRFRIDFARNINVGPGKVDLLEAIRDSGSLSQAARDVDMSYRRAWLLLANLNGSFRQPLTQATTGGRGGGGVALTKFGYALIKKYRSLEAVISRAAARNLRAIVPHVAAPRVQLRTRPRRLVRKRG